MSPPPYFSVKDNGEVIRQDATNVTIRQVAGWISDKVEPPISPTIDRLADEDAKAYIRVAFSGMDAPYSADERYFTRVGTSNKQMAASELATMIIERERNPWDSLPSGTPIEDVDEAAVREAIANALCHRSYTTGTAVEVNVCMDFGEVVSPGLFPEGDAPEIHLAGGDGDLKQRNPGIAEIGALREWRKIPGHIRKLLLANAFCRNYGTTEFALGYTLRMLHGCVLIAGRCAECGAKVARLCD